MAQMLKVVPALVVIRSISHPSLQKVASSIKYHNLSHQKVLSSLLNKYHGQTHVNYCTSMVPIDNLRHRNHHTIIIIESCR